MTFIRQPTSPCKYVLNCYIIIYVNGIVLRRSLFSTKAVKGYKIKITRYREK